MRWLIPALAFSIACAFVPRTAKAQFIPERGPSLEQQEFATVILLAPEAGILGAFLVGGGAFLIARECCASGDGSEDVPIEPVAIGAALGSAIGTTLAVWSIADNFHPGSKRNAALGAALGAGVGTAIFFGGPEGEEASSDQILRLVTFLFLPSLAAYAGWHVDPYGGFAARPAPTPAWARHIGPERERPGPVMSRFSIRF